MEDQPIPGLASPAASGGGRVVPKPRRGGSYWRKATVRRDCADCVDRQARAYAEGQTMMPNRERAAYCLHIETVGGDAVGFYCSAHAHRRGYRGRA